MIEKFQKEDYEDYVSLLKKRSRPIMPLSFLPPTGVKYVAGGKAIAYGFLIKTDTPFASICDLVTDADASGVDREVALIQIISSLESEAASCGYTAVSGATNHRGLGERYVKLGYLASDKDLVMYTRVLCRMEQQQGQ